MTMPLLQSGVTADLSAMSPVTLAILLGGIVVVLAMLMWFAGRHISKIGPVDMSKERRYQNTEYIMNRENRELDETLRMKIRSLTAGMKTRLTNIFAEYRMCPIAVIALSHAVPGPLYVSAANNHFTTVLLPDNRPGYLAGLLRAVEDEYRAAYNAMPPSHCEGYGQMPAWDDISGRAEKYIAEWCDRVITEVVMTCQKKIETYKKHEQAFKGDREWEDRIKSCIDKNERYIKELDRRGR